MKFAAKSDRGMVRSINEDSFNIIAGYPGLPACFVVADGMGGHNSGEIASRMAVDFISSTILQSPGLLSDEGKMPDAVQDIIQRANAVVYESSKQEGPNFGMGTTLILAVASGKKMHVGHIGDSRAYMARDGRLKRLTSDHTYIAELIKKGTITEEEAMTHPKRSVLTKALGCEENILADINSFDCKAGDTFLICTDGLSNELREEEINEILQRNEEPGHICGELVRKANEKGGEDNITVVVVKCD